MVYSFSYPVLPYVQSILLPSVSWVLRLKMTSPIFFFLVPRKQNQKGKVPNPHFINYALWDLHMDSFVSCSLGFFICGMGT